MIWTSGSIPISPRGSSRAVRQPFSTSLQSCASLLPEQMVLCCSRATFVTEGHSLTPTALDTDQGGARRILKQDFCDSCLLSGNALYFLQAYTQGKKKKKGTHLRNEIVCPRELQSNISAPGQCKKGRYCVSISKWLTCARSQAWLPALYQEHRAERYFWELRLYSDGEFHRASMGLNPILCLNCALAAFWDKTWT